MKPSFRLQIFLHHPVVWVTGVLTGSENNWDMLKFKAGVGICEGSYNGGSVRVMGLDFLANPWTLHSKVVPDR